MNANELFAANLGKIVTTTAGNLTIESLLDKMGTLKDGTKASYIHMVGDNGIVDLHPEKAKQLLTKGECGVYRILADIAGEAVEVAVATTETVETPVVAADSTVAPVDAAPVVEKKETNKEATLRIYKELNVDGKQRKEIIARMRTELGMSVPGSNTYYQNVKSGMWK